MFFFLLKKAFFDAWDNLGTLVLGNLILMPLVVGGLWPVFKVLELGFIAGLLMLLIVIALVFVAVGVISVIMSEIADYRRVSWGDLGGIIKKTWKTSLLLSLVASVFFGISFFGMSYYSGLRNMLGLAAAALLFWIIVGVYLSLMWFYPARNRLNGDFRKWLKKGAILMFDNMGLTLFIGLIVAPVQMILWPMTMFTAFGPAGIQLYLNGALRLMMFKYDWLEEHPEATKKDVPWFELLMDEKERVGKRTLRGMIFPWKE